MKKISKRVLLVYPHERIWNLFKSNGDVVFLDDKGWWILDKVTLTRRLIEINDIEENYTDNVNFKSILERVDWWGPIWHRWVANADQYELLKREALIYVLKIIAGLRFFEISNSIFHTGVSHHLDTLLVEIACSSNNVPQVFLYCSVVSGRLLPLIQKNSISDRQPLGTKISQYDATKDIHNFKMPVSKRMTVFNPKSTNKNFRYAFYRLFLEGIRSFIANKVKYLIGYKSKGSNPILNEQSLKLADHLRLIKQQQKALSFYFLLSPKLILF